MSIAEDRPQDTLEDRPLAAYHRLDGIEQGPAHIGDGRDLHRHASILSRTSRNSFGKLPRSFARRTHPYRSSRSPTSRWRKSTSESSAKIRRKDRESTRLNSSH